MANKKYYWLKLQHNFFNDLKIKKLRKTPGGDTSTIILLKIMLSTLHNSGILVYEGVEQTLTKELALKLDEDEANIQVVLIFMEKMQLIEEFDVDQYSLPDVVKNTGAESDSAERKRKQRTEKLSKSVTLSHECHALVTSGHKNVTTEKEKEKEKRKTLSPLSSLTNKIHTSQKTFKLKDERGENKKFLSFVNQIRKEYAPTPEQNIFPSIMEVKDSDGIISACKIDNKGYLYLSAPGRMQDLTSAEADRYWHLMFENQDRLFPSECKNPHPRKEVNGAT